VEPSLVLFCSYIPGVCGDRTDNSPTLQAGETERFSCNLDLSGESRPIPVNASLAVHFVFWEERSLGGL